MLKFAHIKKPLTISEIVRQYEEESYNAELLLQHLFIQFFILQLENTTLKLNTPELTKLSDATFAAIKSMQEFREASKNIKLGEY